MLNADQSSTIAADKLPCHQAEALEANDMSVALDSSDTLSKEQNSQDFCGSCANGCQCVAANFMLVATPVWNGAVNATNSVIISAIDAVIVALQINPFRPPIT